MDDLQPPTALGPVGRQTTTQTARFVKRRLRHRWPDQTFSVTTDKDRRTISVAWSNGPTTEQVHDITRHHSRDTAPAPTLWSSPSGVVCVIETKTTIALHRRT